DPDDVLAQVRTTDNAMGVWEKMWGEEARIQSWGPRVEQIMRNSAWVLMDAGLSLLELRPLLQDQQYRHQALKALTNDEVKDFFVHQYDRWPERQRVEWIESTLNKIDPFIVNPILREILGQ